MYYLAKLVMFSFGFASLVRIEIMASTSTSPPVEDCSLKAQRIGTGLGSLVLVETLFCCFVLYRWIKKNRATKPRVQQSNVEDEQQPMNTDGESSTPQQPINKEIRNYEPLSKTQTDSSYQSLAKKRLQKKRSETMFRRMIRNVLKYSKQPSDHSQAQVLNNDVYYEPTGTLDTAQPQAQHDPLYHVLEDPQGAQGQPDSLYYCSEDCVDYSPNGNSPQARDDAYYHVLENPETQEPQGAQAQVSESLYYSSEDCVESVTMGSTPKTIKPQAYIPGGKEAKNDTLDKPLPYPHSLESTSNNRKIPAANQMARKPLKCKTGLRDHVIQEIKTVQLRTRQDPQ